jgi:ABC-type antimicrobial peptide transport system permease subunit
MVFKNLLRRKARTLLTVLGISIGVAAIIALGAMGKGLTSGYNAMLSGSRSDLVLSQPNSIDLSYSSINEKVGPELAAMPEVARVSPMIQGFVQTTNAPYFFVFGYPVDSYLLNRFQLIQGIPLNNPQIARMHGKPAMLGSAAAESLKKKLGDTLVLSGSAYRIVGIYQTGDAFEDSGALLSLAEAQQLMGKPRQVSLYYIELKDPSLRPLVEKRVARTWKDLSLSTTAELASKQMMGPSLDVFAWVIAGLAIVLGGVSMMNSQLMSVYERTREIGVLRAVGWTRRRILWMILGETVIVCFIGGLLGILIGWATLALITRSVVMFGTSTANITPGLIIQSLITVLALGVIGGLYPARHAADLQPVEALRYEGGSSGEQVHRLPVGGMAIQSLWQRTTRTLLTLSVIALTVGSIMSLESVIKGTGETMNSYASQNKMEIMLRQANISDTSLSAIDERYVQRIAALPEVQTVSGMIFTAVMMSGGQGFFIVEGFNPGDPSFDRFRIVDGKSLTNNRQVLLGKTMSESLKKGVGDSIEVGGSRFRVVGVFESSIGWEMMGGVITLRDAQTLVGRPRKVTMLGVKLRDPSQAEGVVKKINQSMPDIHAALSGDFAAQMPDMVASNSMMSGISFLAIIVGGLGVMNTMLMAVLERTREIGVLRSVGWQRRDILWMILKESIILALLGAASGMILAPVLNFAISSIPSIGAMYSPQWDWAIFARALAIALLLGAVGGIYPAYRATRLQPVEALRYE